MTGEDIQRRLVDFGRKWSLYDGSERAEAQTFLNELFACYGTDRAAAGARFEEIQRGKFLDLIWPRRCIIEMKRPSEAGRLANHREQALGYWRYAADPSRNVPAPRFVVLCAFQRFEIWEPGAFPNEPRADFTLLDLPDRRDALMFLADREPVFVASQEAVTRQAVQLMTNLYHRLGDRMAAAPDVRRNFLLQTLWCLFAEDLGQLEGHLYTRIVDGLIENPQRSSVDDLGGLFDWLNRPGPRPQGGLYADTRYVNAGCSTSRPSSTSSPTSCSPCASRATTTGARSSRTSSARSCRARSAGTRSTRWARITPMRSTSRRSSSRRSSTPGESASKQRTPSRRSRRFSRTSSTTWFSTPPAARATSCTPPTGSCAASSAGCTSGRASCGARRAGAERSRARSQPSSR